MDTTSITNTLKEIGFTTNEIKVYITLLKIGPSNVSKLAQHSGLYRPYVYDTLERLQEKGLVSYGVVHDKKIFIAAPPEQLIVAQNEKLNALQKVLPELNQLMNLSKEEGTVNVYNGKQVIRVIQKMVLTELKENGGENLVIGVDEKRFMEADPIMMQLFFNEMKKEKLNERVLVRKGDNYLPGHKQTTKYRFLPKEYFSPTATFVYGNNIAIILFTQPLTGIMIESRELANTYRKQFELLWKIAKRLH